MARFFDDDLGAYSGPLRTDAAAMARARQLFPPGQDETHRRTLVGRNWSAMTPTEQMASAATHRLASNIRVLWPQLKTDPAAVALMRRAAAAVAAARNAAADAGIYGARRIDYGRAIPRGDHELHWAPFAEGGSDEPEWPFWNPQPGIDARRDSLLVNFRTMNVAAPAAALLSADAVADVLYIDALNPINAQHYANVQALPPIQPVIVDENQNHSPTGTGTPASPVNVNASPSTEAASALATIDEAAALGVPGPNTQPAFGTSRRLYVANLADPATGTRSPSQLSPALLIGLGVLLLLFLGKGGKA